MDPVLSPLPCPSLIEVQQLWRDIPVKIQRDPTAGDLVCRQADGSLDLSVAQFQVYRALLFLRDARFDAPLPWTTLTVWEWLKATIPNGVVIGVGDLSYAYLNTKGPIYLNYPAAGWWNRMDRSMTALPIETIVHEARHAEGYSHTCAWDGRQYRSDRTAAEMGATGVGYYLWLWIALHSGEDSALKQIARTHADQKRKGSIFCCECGGR